VDWTSAALWAGLLAGLRAGPADFALRPERWPTRSENPAVEAVLREPLSGPAAVDALEAKLDGAPGSAGLAAAGFAALGVVPSEPTPAPGPDAPTPALPAYLAAAVARLVAGLSGARKDLALAVASLPPADRVRARRAAEAAIGDDPLVETRGEDFDAAERFDLPRLAAAAQRAAAAADRAAADLALAPRDGGPAFSVRWPSAIGTVIVSSGDAEFGPEDLANAGLIVRLGGRTRYRGPAAAAGEGQVRAILDLGGPASIESAGPAAGSADFGIGLLYLLGPGPHRVEAGELSLGAARFGAALAVVAGDGSTLSSRRFGQGAAAYGVGALDTSGAGLRLKLPLAGQGFGTTRGAGLWRHRGEGLSASCGFEVPDAREALGSLSLGQGAGMGPRAFAAGGVGAALVRGADARLDASYFAQGSGYWHGLGALFVRGDGARLQSRRYGLGSGVHAGVGALDVQGDRAEIAAWGAGPALGWDGGLGLFRLRGDDARVRSDWADGRSDYGGRALAWLEGERDRFSLADFGTGSFTRAQAGYGLAVIKGRDQRLRAAALARPRAVRAGALVRASPWGALSAPDGLTLDPALKLPDPVWTAPDRASSAAVSNAAAAALAASGENEGERARLARCLFAASAAILDPRPAEGAARDLAGLAADDAPILASLIDADRFDELTWARLAASGLGPAAARAAADEAARSDGPRRAVLIDWLRFGRAEESLPALENFLGSDDWRARRAAASALGSLFDDSGGDEPGRRRLLRAASSGAAAPENLGRKRLADLYAALALASAPSADERLALLAKSGSPFDAVAPDAERAFAALVSSGSPRAAALASEEASVAALLPRARADLRAAAADPDDEAAAAALEALGGLGVPDDAGVLSAALAAPSAARRDAAASGLARLGAAGRAAVARSLGSDAARERALAALAAAASPDAQTFGLLSRAFGDGDPAVRAAAVAGLGAAQGTMLEAKAALLPALRDLAAGDSDPGVRASAALAAAAIAPAAPR